jgi:hypothetical protein
MAYPIGRSSLVRKERAGKPRFWKLTVPVPFWWANGWKTLVPQYHHQGRRNHYFRIA